ncbi:MAG: FAD-dependent oxidoreductase [Bryobacterales bacterium]|nr:FAD-dependent oxidoreductase [Bryobacterales bacterium]
MLVVLLLLAELIPPTSDVHAQSAEPVPATPGPADVIIIGAGIGGLSTAWEAGRQGLRVTVIDMFSVFGGHAVMSEGGLAMVATAYQAENGVTDSPKLAIRDFTDWGEDASIPWVEAFAHHSRERVFDWLVSLGVRFSGLRKQAGNRTARFHENAQRGLGVVTPIYRDCLRYPNIRFEWNTQALKLLREGNRVVGVKVVRLRTGKEQELLAPAVVVATGGYQSSLELVRESWPAHLPFPENLLLGAGLNAVGSGLGLGKEAGAAIERMDHQWNYPWGMVDPRFPGERRGINARVPNSIWVNSRGERFVNEVLNARDALVALLSQNPSLYWAVFDSQGKRSMSVAGTHWTQFARVEQQLIENPKVTAKADTLEALANSIDVPPATLAATVARYNQMVESGDDVDFQRFGPGVPDPRKINDRMQAPPRRIETPPFYAIPMGPLTRKSMGGLRVDLQCRVLTESGEPIEGLYAVGEVTGFGGINGKAGLEGTFLAPGMFQGRAAGEAIANLAGSRIHLTEPRHPPKPDRGTDDSQCQTCHNLNKLLAAPRPGYQHFELVHNVVAERSLRCIACHSEQSPFRASAHRIHRTAQTENCAFCHLGR